MAKSALPLFPAFDTPEFKRAMANGMVDMQHVVAEIEKTFPGAKLLPRCQLDEQGTVTATVTL